MWKISALALLTATLMAGSMQQPASAQGFGFGRCDMRVLQRNGNSNRQMPPDWVHDPVTQRWLAPNSREAMIACQHQMEVNAGQQRENYLDRRDEQREKEADARHELRETGVRRCDFSILTRNGRSNPSMPPDWVHDPVTQAWLAPNSAQAELACAHQAEINAGQGGGERRR